MLTATHENKSGYRSLWQFRSKLPLGVVTQSDSERTSIDFHLHGPKKFATSLMTVEVTDEVPPPKPRPPKRQRISTRVPRVTLSADAK